MLVEVLAAPKFTPTQAGDEVAGHRVEYSNDYGGAMILSLPDDWDAGKVAEEMARLVRRGDLLPFDGGRIYRDVQPLWTPQWIPPPGGGWSAYAQSPVHQAGDTFPIHGVTPQVQERGKHGRGRRIGHVDTWSDTGHPWFSGLRIEQAGDGADGQVHGTHTLGTLCGEYGLLQQPEAVFSFNCLPGGSGTQDKIARAIDWCVDQGVHLISSSLGSSHRSPMIDQAVLRAISRGVTFVNAAGNAGDTLQPGSPAAVASLQVMACDRGLHSAAFSEGRRWNTRQRVYGEGVQVVSAFPDGKQGPADGTSMACPHIAGLVGLLQAGGEVGLEG